VTLLLLFLLAADPHEQLQIATELGKNGPDTEETADRLLAMARDPHAPNGVRVEALLGYARVSARRKTGAEAARNVWALRGKLGGSGDPALEALGALGPPALPVLAQAIRGCGKPEAGDGQMAAALLVALVRENQAAPEALALAPDLVRCLDCADRGVRQLCARALGALSRVEPRQVAAVRRRLASDRRPDGRALAAAILAALSARDPASVKALERALGDRAETVQLSSANALMQLQRPARARPALERLKQSEDPEIAGLAAGVLRNYPTGAAAP
jgi:hypothetical protein